MSSYKYVLEIHKMTIMESNVEAQACFRLTPCSAEKCERERVVFPL